MEAKEILQKVKEFFNELTTPEEKKPVKMSEYQLKDGGMVQIEELTVGGVVMIDGAPALPGELELVDGTKIVVGENGVISEVKPASETPAPEMPEMDMGSKFAAFDPAKRGSGDLLAGLGLGGLGYGLMSGTNWSDPTQY